MQERIVLMDLHKYHNPMYQATVQLVVCPVAPFNGWFKRTFRDDTQHAFPHTGGLMLPCGGVITKWDAIIWLNEQYADTAMLVHECFHASRHILRERNVSLREDDEPQEVVAYLMSDMFKVLNTKWEKSKNNKRRK